MQLLESSFCCKACTWLQSGLERVEGSGNLKVAGQPAWYCSHLHRVDSMQCRGTYSGILEMIVPLWTHSSSDLFAWTFSCMTLRALVMVQTECICGTCVELQQNADKNLTHPVRNVWQMPDISLQPTCTPYFKMNLTHVHVSCWRVC